VKKFLPVAALTIAAALLMPACSKPGDAPAPAAAAPGESALATLPDLKVAIDPTYEPFGFKTPDGKLTGFDIDFALAVCAEIRRNCVFVEQVWDSMIPGLMAKKYDVIISSMGITEDRLAHIDFSDKYYNTPNRLILKKGSIYTGPSSIKGKRIGVGKSTIQEKYAMGELTPAGVKVVPYDAQDQVYLDIKAGRLDGTVADYVEVLGGFLSKPEGTNYEAFGPELYGPKYFGIGVGIGIRKGQDALKAELNAAIKTIRTNGTYKTINDTYFGKFGVDVWGK
jgi:arginine/ornithine transport system substrate-binding protein